MTASLADELTKSPKINPDAEQMPYRNDMGGEAVGIVSTLHDGRELWVADPSLLAGGAHGARADPDLDDIGAGEDQGLYHVACHHVARLQTTIHLLL